MSYVKIHDAGELSPLTDVVLLSDHNKSLFEKEKLISNQAKRIAELEEQLKELAERECVLCRKKIKELEQALDMASDPALHPTCSDCDKCSAISILETTEPKWISVKDRKPPKGQHVLVARNPLIRSLYPIDVVNWIEDYITHDIVTHWMPLPSTTEENK